LEEEACHQVNRSSYPACGNLDPPPSLFQVVVSPSFVSFLQPLALEAPNLIADIQDYEILIYENL
jgi:hypothetical protein